MYINVDIYIDLCITWVLNIGEYTPQKLRNSHCCVPFTATFSKRRKIGSLWSERCDSIEKRFSHTSIAKLLAKVLVICPPFNVGHTYPCIREINIHTHLPPFPLKKRSAVAHVNSHQRSLPTTQAHYPTTEDTAGFCLLCCQPEPLPQSLSTRTSLLTRRCPCGVPTWSGRAINAARRTLWEHMHFTDQLPLGWQEDVTPPSWSDLVH